MSEDVQQAIDRARKHLRVAMRESIEATRALVDAALLAGGLDTADRGGMAAEVRAILDSWLDALDRDQPFRMPSAFVDPLEHALRTEIDRWEKRSASDPTARPVLRAFLGLRELLWELGLHGTKKPDTKARNTRPRKTRSTAGRPTATGTTPKPTDTPKRTARSRVQRFDLED